jgi:predicted HicB family RNase H-like nuclease
MNYLSYKGYTATMDYDAEDHLLTGCLAGLRDRIVFHGETVAGFENAFRESVDAYIENCAALGKDPENRRAAG